MSDIFIKGAPVQDVDKFNEELKAWFLNSYPGRVADVDVSEHGLAERLPELTFEEIRNREDLPHVPADDARLLAWCKTIIDGWGIPKDIRYFVRFYPSVVMYNDRLESDPPYQTLRIRIYAIK